MRIGFLWGILSGSVAAGALAWIAVTMTEPTPHPGTPQVEKPADTEEPAAASAGDAAPDASASPQPEAAAITDGMPEQAGRPAPEGGGDAGGPAQVGNMPAGASASGAVAPDPARDSSESGAGAAATDVTDAADSAAGADAGTNADLADSEREAALGEGPADTGGAADAEARAGSPAKAAERPEGIAPGVPARGGTSDAAPEDPLAPGFDIVRIDAQGQAVIAGRAGPEQLVEILLDGEVVETARTDRSGNFVAVIRADLGGEARQLQLRVSVPRTEVAADASEPAEPIAEAVREPAAAQAAPPEAAAPTADAPEGTERPGGPATPEGAHGVEPAPPAAPSDLATDQGAPSTTIATATPSAGAAPPDTALPPRPRPREIVGATPSAEGMRSPETAVDEESGSPESDQAYGGPADPTGGDAAATDADSRARGETEAGRITAGEGSNAAGLGPAGGEDVAEDTSTSVMAAGPDQSLPGQATGSGTASTAMDTADQAREAVGGGNAGDGAAEGTATTGAGSASSSDRASSDRAAETTTGASDSEPAGIVGGDPPSMAAAPGAVSVSDKPPVVTSGPDSGEPAHADAGTTGGRAQNTGGLVQGDGTAGAPAAITGEAAAAAPAPEPGMRYVLSAPVLILPSQEADGAPALVQPKSDRLALLQPSGGAGGEVEAGIVLDQITYGAAGDVQARGRATDGRAVRVYGDGRLLDTVPVREGLWLLSLPRARVETLSLFRFDEIGPAGQVTSRIEAPFSYTGDRPQVLRDREVVIQRGDNLWRIAEQFYGEGIRYSVIYGANSELIRDPDLIYPDQVFTIPELVEAD